MLEVRVRNDDGQTICHLVGDLDAATSEVLRATLHELADQVTDNRTLVIDLSDVPFIDSAGLGAVISGVRAVREKGGDVTLTSPRPSVANLLRATEIDQVVVILHTRPAPTA